jgi:hypothetical protein
MIITDVGTKTDIGTKTNVETEMDNKCYENSDSKIYYRRSLCGLSLLRVCAKGL